MSEDNKGHIYMLTSPSFREDGMKIGKSSRPVNVLSNELNNTVVSLPFEIYATLKTSKYDKVEYQGRLWSLSTFTREFLPEDKQSTSGAYRGPKYFSYEGITLSNL